MVEYGNGIGLDNNFDLAIGADGDIAAARGLSELQKDLAFNIGAALNSGEGVDAPSSVATGVVGSVLDRGLKADIETVVNRIASEDSRVTAVRGVTVEQGPQRGTVVVQLRVVADDESVPVGISVP